MKPPSIKKVENFSNYSKAPYYEIARHSHNYSDEVVRFYSDSGAVVATKTINSSNDDKVKTTRRNPPSRQKSKQRRAAFRMYELIKCIPEQARTESQKSSYEWALSVVGEFVKTGKKCEKIQQKSIDSKLVQKSEQKSAIEWVDQLVDGLFKTPTNSEMKQQQLEENQQQYSADWATRLMEFRNSSESFPEDQLSSATKTESRLMACIDRNGHNGSSHSYEKQRTNATAFKPCNEARNRNEHSDNINEHNHKINEQNDNKNERNGSSADHPNDNNILVIIDRNQLDGSLTLEKWNKVQIKLASVFLSVLGEHPGPPPVCTDCGWHQRRYKLIACTDQRSMQLYKIAISRMGAVWPGANLRVILRNQIPSAPRARCRMPAEPSDTQTILEIIRVSNPQLPTSTWKILKLEQRVGDYRAVTFAINAESLEPLARTDGVINYGFTAITMKVYKSDEMFFQKSSTKEM